MKDSFHIKLQQFFEDVRDEPKERPRGAYHSLNFNSSHTNQNNVRQAAICFVRSQW